MSKKWINTTADKVVTISGIICNDDTRTVANAVNYNAQILKDALNRIAKIERTIKSQTEGEGAEITLDKAIKILESNAEYERTHGNLQDCLNFRQLAEWLKELKAYREREQKAIRNRCPMV